MSTVLPSRSSWRPGRGMALLLVVAAIGGCAAGGYVFWKNSHRIDVPPVQLSGIEPEVAAELEQARAEIVKSPRLASAWGQVGLILFAHDYYQLSKSWLEEADRLDPKDVRWPYYLALANLRKDPETAIDYLKRASELRPGDSLIRLRLAEELNTAGRADEAETAFREVLRHRPDEACALLGLGQILTQRGEARAALPLLSRAASDPTARQSARVALADAHARLGDEKAADEHRRIADSLPPDAPWIDPRLAELAKLQTGMRARTRLGHSMLLSGQVQQAITHLTNVVRDHPESAEAHLMLGQALIRAGAFREAEAAVARAIKLDSNLATAHYQNAVLLMRRADYTGAEASLRRVLELRPTHALAHFGVGECRRKAGDRPAAIAAMQEALRHHPGLASAYRELGEMQLEAGQIDLAIGNLEAATRLEPANKKAGELLSQARARKSP